MRPAHSQKVIIITSANTVKLLCIISDQHFMCTHLFGDCCKVLSILNACDVHVKIRCRLYACGADMSRSAHYKLRQFLKHFAVYFPAAYLINACSAHINYFVQILPEERFIAAAVFDLISVYQGLACCSVFEHSSHYAVQCITFFAKLSK